MKLSHQFATCAMLGLFAGATHAAVLVDYDISGGSDGNSYNGPVAVGVLAANVTASSLTTNDIPQVAVTNNKANALGGNNYNDPPADYFSFTLTPDAGYTLDIDTIHFNEGSNNVPAASTAWELRSSLDGFSSVIATEAIGAGNEDITDNAAYQQINLGSAFDAVAGPIEFRILAGNANVGFSWQYFIGDPTLNFDNFTVEGTANVIPEPTTALLVALLSPLALTRRRRRSL